ncbi:MAG: hypothetical protein KAX49_15765 [Halanaerobiales bacterium]|nr:hypothetical protein [Halanaerobiales bacterium]
MSKFVCLNGTLVFSNSLDFADGSWCLNNVTIDISADTVNYPCMGVDGWTDSLASTKSATFSWETALDSVDGIDLDNTIGKSGILIFDTVDGGSYNATVIITSANINAPVDDVATVSWEAICDGDIEENLS